MSKMMKDTLIELVLDKRDEDDRWTGTVKVYHETKGCHISVLEGRLGQESKTDSVRTYK